MSEVSNSTELCNSTEKSDKPVEDKIESPTTSQLVKSSDEILCELFGAFNAKPPILDEATILNISKKEKKHIKSDKKKKKKRKRSLSSASRNNSSNSKKKKKKKDHDKGSNSNSKSSNTKEKKVKKLGKYSASDPDSDDDNKSKLLQLNEDSLPKKPKLENDYPKLIQEDVLKDTVSKIVDKVIDSTRIKTEVCDYSPLHKSGNLLKKSWAINQPEDVVVKDEPKSSPVPPKPDESGTELQAEQVITNGQFNDIPFPNDSHMEVSNGKSEKTSEVKIINPDKPSKIKIQNLKFSEVYKATVMQIEEAARRKAEKYEEGELTETSEERSLTPSIPSSSDSVVELPLHESLENRQKCHHKKNKSHHRKRSSEERHRSRSHHKKRSKSKEKRVKERHNRRSRSRNDDTKEVITKRRRHSSDRSRRSRNDRSRSPHSRDRGDDSRERHNNRDRSRSHDSSKNRSKKKSKSPEKSKEWKSESRRTENRASRTNDRKGSRERASSIDKKTKLKSNNDSSHSKDSNNRNSDEKIDKQKLLDIARKNVLNMMKGSSVVEQNKVVSFTAGGKTVTELTDFCKQLSKKDAEGHESISSDTELSSGSDSERPFHHPFKLKDRISSIKLNIRNSTPLPVKSLQEKTAEQAKELRLQFPVSSGQQHRKKEHEWRVVEPEKPQPLAITAPPPQMPPPVRRKRTFTDTPDPPIMDLRDTLRANCVTPGQFTGSTGVRMLTQAELAGGPQAWARKDQLQIAAPVNSGMGMTLLQKMGWRPGEGLGKNKEGALQPLLLEVKMDKKGLVSQEELPVRQPHQIIRRPQRSLEGKHPVSLLNEYCSRRKFIAPTFELIDEVGPDHKKNFRFKVKVNGVEYTPAVGSPKKKQARAEAAEVCLKELGILPAR